jgi:hypothetical protein
MGTIRDTVVDAGVCHLFQHRHTSSSTVSTRDRNARASYIISLIVYICFSCSIPMLVTKERRSKVTVARIVECVRSSHCVLRTGGESKADLSQGR